MALEGVLEGVWEAKIIDFGSFFEKRSIRNASRNQVEEHVEKISKKNRKSVILEAKMDKSHLTLELFGENGGMADACSEARTQRV